MNIIMSNSRYWLAYRMARDTDLGTKFGRALYWFAMISYSVSVLALCVSFIAFFGYSAIWLTARHFGWNF